jgi:para-aminobenzoate synthetase component 1
MNRFSPFVLDSLPEQAIRPPGAPPECSELLWERSRLEWRISDSRSGSGAVTLGDNADPAVLIEDFLVEAGLAVRDLSIGGLPLSCGTPSMIGSSAGHAADTVCGAAVFISAAAGARMIGAPTGPPTPAPAIPDIAVIVYGHRSVSDSPSASGPPEPPFAPELAAPPFASGPAGPVAVPSFAPAGRAQLPAAPHQSLAPWRLGPWEASWSPVEHARAVEGVRAAIARGDVYQVNLVGHAAAGYTGNPMPALRRVAELPGARYAGVLRGAGWAIASASPETLVEVTGGHVVTRPIKGTRLATPAGRRELLESSKERAEHIMIVDLERNDLAQIAATGSVRVDDLYAIRRWCDLWQAESEVSARLADGIGLATLLRAVCPGGSVTGAPKRSALAELARWEPVGRGASMGALGWISAGRLDLGLSIRTVAVDAHRVHLWAGGGITWGSDPAAEVAEAAAKAAPLRAALA